MKIYFSDFFEISPDQLEAYGAFNISLINDLPLFVDPFLLFNSKKKEYQQLHQSIIDYVIFLRDMSGDSINDALIKSLFSFPEVKQNWFGYSTSGNSGSGLGKKFAFALHDNLTSVFANFGKETISKGSHLEKLCLIDSGVGRDNISDFVTNLIKGFLLEYTQEFAQKYIDSKLLKRFHVPKVQFNIHTSMWASSHYVLPKFGNDFVLLTPKDILTKDDSWINRADTYNHLDDIMSSIPNDQLRAHMNHYFRKVLPVSLNKKPNKQDEQTALSALIKKFPEFLDYYIQYKEKHGNKAVSISQEKVKTTELIFIKQLRQLINILQKTDFYNISGSSHAEAMKRVLYLKQVIENNDGYRLFYAKGQPIKREQDLHIMYRLTWHASDFDVNSEVNNGRGPVDYKISKGHSDKTLIEFKLASNTKLKNNLAKQVQIYESANQAVNSIKVILFFSSDEERKIKKVLKDLQLDKDDNVVLIDARNDNKKSASNVSIEN